MRRNPCYAIFMALSLFIISSLSLPAPAYAMPDDSTEVIDSGGIVKQMPQVRPPQAPPPPPATPSESGVVVAVPQQPPMVQPHEPVNLDNPALINPNPPAVNPVPPVAAPPQGGGGVVIPPPPPAANPGSGTVVAVPQQPPMVQPHDPLNLNNPALINPNPQIQPQAPVNPINPAVINPNASPQEQAPPPPEPRPPANPPQGGSGTALGDDFTHDISIDRLRKFSDTASGRLDQKIGVVGVIKPPRNQGIAGPQIVCDTGGSRTPLVGSNIKYMIAPNFTFGNGNISSAEIIWTAEAAGARTTTKTVKVTPRGGNLANLGSASFEIKPAVPANFKVTFEIKYKLFGDTTEYSATAIPITTAVVSGNAAIDDQINAGNTLPVLIIGVPGGDSVGVAIVSKQIKVDFARGNAVQEPDIKEQTPYTWTRVSEEPPEPNCNPGPVHAYIRLAIRLGADNDSDDENGIDANEFGGLPADKQGNYFAGPDGRFRRKGGIRPGGSGPIPGTLKGCWTVKYPSSANGGGGWNTAYDRSSIGVGNDIAPLPAGQEGDSFTFSAPYPTEPLYFEISMKVKHRWCEYEYDRAGSQLSQAIATASRLHDDVNAGAPSQCNGESKVFIGIVTPATLATLVINPGGGDGRRGGGVGVTISNTCTYSFQPRKKVDDGDDPDKPGKKKNERWENDGPPQQATYSLSASFGCGKTKDKEYDDITDPCVKYEKVLDTVAPKISFDAGSMLGNGAGDVVCGSGDFVLVKVVITDNNLYAPLGTPYLTYETAPSAGGGQAQNWAAVPLQMERIGPVPDNGSPRPFAAGNTGKFQALVPVPHNVKGSKAIKWFVDAFDGSKAPHTPEFQGAPNAGNHNKGNFHPGPGAHDGKAKETHEVGPNLNGTISIYDNDRPNLTVRVWKVDRAGVYMVGEFVAAEDYFTPDCYFQTNDPQIIDNSNMPGGAYSGFKGMIPGDASILAGGYQPAFPMTTLFPAARKQEILAGLPEQVENRGFNHAPFTYSAGQTAGANGNCAVLFEDVKYIFTVDAADNIEAVATSGATTPIPRPERTVISFKLKDREGEISADRMEFRAGQRTAGGSGDAVQRWYLGPEDPGIPVANAAALPMEVPTFEHVFHSVSKPGESRYLSVTAFDCVNHERSIKINLNISQVTNELRVLEEKIKRDVVRNNRR